MSRAAELARHARARITNPNNWTQGANARLPNGRGIMDAFDSKATQWCMIGAVAYSTIELAGQQSPASVYIYEVMNALRAAIHELCPNDIQSVMVGLYNDSHTHEEVLAVFDRAIELLENT